MAFRMSRSRVHFSLLDTKLGAAADYCLSLSRARMHGREKKKEQRRLICMPMSLFTRCRSGGALSDLYFITQNTRLGEVSVSMACNFMQREGKPQGLKQKKMLLYDKKPRNLLREF